MSKKILVTGGAGFIGSHTCIELLNNGNEVVVVDNLYNANKKSLEVVERVTGKKVTFYEVDIRDEEKLCWNFEKAETELWKEPPEPLLECIANLVTEENPTWQGTATELIEKLGLDMKPNVVSLKLNVNAGRLMNDYSIRYTNKRNHSGRMIFFSLLSKE